MEEAPVGAPRGGLVARPPRAEPGPVCVPQTRRRRKKRRARMSCRRTSLSRPAASRLRWAPRLWSHRPSWRGQTRAASSCRHCPPAKPAAFPAPHRPPSPTAPPRQGPSQLLWLRCHRSSFGQGQEGASKTGKAGGGPCPPPMGPAQSQGRAEPQLQTLTQKTCLKEPATVPRCPLGQPAWPLGPKGCIISLPPSPSPTPTTPGGRQAGPLPCRTVNLFSSLALHSLSWAQP